MTTDDGWGSPRLSEDLEASLVPGGPSDYAISTDGPVRYVLVANGEGVVLGYLWAAEQDDAANFLPRPAAGIPARQAKGAWKTELRERKHRDLTPVQAIGELSDGVGHPNYGWVVAGSEATAPSLDALKEIASQG